MLGVIYTIPSLSMFVLLIPLFGLGFTPAVITQVVYAQFGLIRTWVLGLTSIDPAICEAALGLGMGGWQRLAQVEFPLTLPFLLAGIRIAVVTIIRIGTAEAFINAGGLGVLLFEGVITANPQKITVGGLVLSVFAISASYGLRYLERLSDRRTRED